VTPEELERLRRSYRAAFLHCMSGTDERALHAAYEIGRAAVGNRTSLLELAQIHHEVLAEVLRTSSPPDLDRITGAASAFLVEVLAAFDMTQGTGRRVDNDT